MSYPPTDKQMAFLARLNYDGLPPETKEEASWLIDAKKAGKKGPALENAFREIRELLHVRDQWDEFAETIEYMLAIYKRGKNIIVDVLLVNGADVDDRGKLKLILAAPKLVNDSHIGQYLEWEKDFEIPAINLLYNEAWRSKIPPDDLKGYEKAVKKGLKIAKKLPKQSP